MYMAKKKIEASFSLTLQSRVGQLAAFFHTVIQRLSLLCVGHFLALLLSASCCVKGRGITEKGYSCFLKFMA